MFKSVCGRASVTKYIEKEEEEESIREKNIATKVLFYSLITGRVTLFIRLV